MCCYPWIFRLRVYPPPGQNVNAKGIPTPDPESIAELIAFVKKHNFLNSIMTNNDTCHSQFW